MRAAIPVGAASVPSRVPVRAPDSAGDQEDMR